MNGTDIFFNTIQFGNKEEVEEQLKSHPDLVIQKKNHFN